MITVGEHGGITFPTGAGIGATHEAWAVMSFARAAGRLPIITFVEPWLITPGPAGTHDGSVQGPLMLPTTAAGIELISTVGTVLATIASGRPG
jgi:hypothetical protein